jgi:hypothetical protein
MKGVGIEREWIFDARMNKIGMGDLLRGFGNLIG